MTVAIVMLGMLVLGTVVSAWQAVRATQAQKVADRQSKRAEKKQSEAEQAQNTAESNLYAADMNLVNQALRDGDIGRAQQLVELYEDRDDIRGPEWYFFREQSRGSHTHRIDLEMRHILWTRFLQCVSRGGSYPLRKDAFYIILREFG